MTGQLPKFLAAINVSKPDQPAERTRREGEVPIGRKRYAAHLLRVALELAEELAGLQVPKTYGKAHITARLQDLPSVRRQRNRVHVAPMAPELLEDLARFGIANLQGMVVEGAAEEVFAVGEERHAGNVYARRPDRVEAFQLLAGFQVPKADGSIPGTR